MRKNSNKTKGGGGETEKTTVPASLCHEGQVGKSLRVERVPRGICKGIEIKRGRVGGMGNGISKVEPASPHCIKRIIFILGNSAEPIVQGRYYRQLPI